MTNNIKFAGDINVETVSIFTKGTGIDITNQIRSIQILESIYYDFTTAIIVVEDASDVISGLQLAGEEIVGIGASTPSESNQQKQLNFAFHLYSISDHVKSGDRAALYKLHCISVEAIVNNNRRFSKGFNDNISNLVRFFLTDSKYGMNTKKKLIIEETANSMQYVSNYWTPAKNIKFLAERGISKETKTPSYLFFENRDGFNFITMQRLFSNPPVALFKKDNNVSKNPSNGAYQTIIDMELHSMLDYYKNVKNGVYSSTLQSYDTTLKRFFSREYTPYNDKNIKLLNDRSPQDAVTTHPSAKQFVINQAYRTFDNVDDVTDSNTVQEHTSILGMARFHALKIKVNGLSAYTAGYPVEVELPKNSHISQNGESIDNMYSGKYIIAEAVHQITGAEHICFLTLIKDSIRK